MTTAPGLFAEAVARGLVSAREALSGRVTVTDQSRSNVVHRVDLDDRPVAYVKVAGPAAALDGDDPVAAERRVLAALTGCPVVPLLIPEPTLPARHPGAPDGDALWTRAVDGIPLYAAHGTPARLAEVARAWGAAVASLHRTGCPTSYAAQGIPVLPAPWVVTPDRLPPSMGEPADGSPLADLRAEARSDRMRWICAELTAHWSPDVLLHGDLGAANVLVDERAGTPVVRLIDLEGAGLGPAAWDLAGALDTLGELVRQWGCPEVVPAFVAGYRAAGGPGSVQPGHLAVRALVSGWQATVGSTVRGDWMGAAAEARVHLERARHWAAVWERHGSRGEAGSGGPTSPRSRGQVLPAAVRGAA